MTEQRGKGSASGKSLARYSPKSEPAPLRIVAYDFETTSIAAGTPRPVWLTAFGADMRFESPVGTTEHLADILSAHFLTDERKGTAYCAWNGNRFDGFFIAVALLGDDRYIVVPYLTRSKALRGIRVQLRDDAGKRTARHWHFLDGIAMTGLAGTSLDAFLERFAPDFRKLTGTIDFEREEFDPDNPAHRAYAMRDSQGLYHGLMRAQSIMLETFGEPLRTTIGATGIRILRRHIPDGVIVRALPEECERIVRDQVMRGGYVYCARQFRGPVWKYDLNQAYAHAMRAVDLPSGSLSRCSKIPHYARAFIACVSGELDSRVPFYVKCPGPTGRIQAQMLMKLDHAWLTAPEIRQLEREGAKLTVHDCFVWSQSFRLTEYVGLLERLRTTCDGGPSGPIGTMVKSTGNNSYGKTSEQLDGIEYIIAAECPPGFQPEFEGADILPNVWWRFSPLSPDKPWHKPQLASFITAFVRMEVRRAALLNPRAWLYADTDCVIFDRDITDRLDIDSKRYGAWKVEESGTEYLIIAKKVYASADGKKRSAKGMNVKRLDMGDFARWFDGDEPTQDQTQLQNFLAVLRGAEMYRRQTRRGTRVAATIPRRV